MSLAEQLNALDDIDGLDESTWGFLVALLAGASPLGDVWEGHLVSKARMAPDRAAGAWSILVTCDLVRTVSMRGGYRTGILTLPGAPDENPTEWRAMIPRMPYTVQNHPAGAIPMFSRVTGECYRAVRLRGQTFHCLDGTKLPGAEARLDIAQPDGCLFALKVILGYFGEAADIADIARRAATGTLSHADLVSVARDLETIANQQNSQE